MTHFLSHELMTLPKRLLVAALAVLAGACGSIVELPNSGEAPSLYNLTALSSPTAVGTEEKLLIEDPVTTGGLDVRNIARRPSSNEMQYYAGARWSGRLSNMVQATLAETFENAGQAVTSGRGGAVVPPRFELQLEIRDFQAEFYNSPTRPDIHVRIAVKLVQLSPLRVLVTSVVDVTQQAYGGDMRSVIDAFDTANHEAMDQIVELTVKAIKDAE
jgi:cholesterol transport system auxiliary component